MHGELKSSLLMPRLARCRLWSPLFAFDSRIPRFRPCSAVGDSCSSVPALTRTWGLER